MTLYSYTAPFTAAYGGNPNLSISAISTNGGIVCSRTSGQTPCFIQVSASGITSTGTNIPYEDLYYEWDFGDVSGTETFTSPGAGGGTVNANDDQRGPEAAYVYRTAGTYTVTLTIKGRNGTAPYTIATVTQAITVTTFSASGGEYWFDSVAGDDGNDGLSIGAPKQNISALNTLLNGTSNRAFHIKRGSSYSGTTTLTIAGAVSGIRIDAYGSGALPVFDISSGTNSVLTMTNGGSESPSTKSDIVISNIKISNSGSAGGHTLVNMSFTNTTAAVSNLYFDNCTNEVTTNGANWLIQAAPTTSLLTNWGFWNCTTSAPAEPIARSSGLYTSGQSWFFMLGGSITGGTTVGGATLDHHIYPNIKTHTLYRYIDATGTSATPRNYFINANWDVSGALQYAEFVLIADCGATGTRRFHELGNELNSAENTLFRNVVCERNRMHGMTGDGLVLLYCCSSYTHRDNEAWDFVTGRYYIPDVNDLGSILTSRIYRNKIHHPTTANANDLIDFASALWTLPQIITDNIIVDLRTLGRAIAIPFTQQAGATIDRNQYYAPNDSDAEYLRDVTTVKSFAEWQAAGFDTNGSVADPGWTDAANGDFS